MFYCHFFGLTESIVNLSGAETHWQDRGSENLSVSPGNWTRKSLSQTPNLGESVKPNQVVFGYMEDREVDLNM